MSAPGTLPGASAALRPAAFLDRDGTLIVERHYLADPEGVELIPGTARALVALRKAGYALVVITNQSGIARGLITPEQYQSVHARLAELLAADEVEIDAVYHCPHHPEHSGPCACRKPGLALYRRAAEEHGLDLARSIYVGDKVSDVIPALELGGTGFLVQTGYGEGEVGRAPEGVRVVADLGGVVERLHHDHSGHGST